MAKSSDGVATGAASGDAAPGIGPSSRAAKPAAKRARGQGVHRSRPGLVGVQDELDAASDLLSLQIASILEEVSMEVGESSSLASLIRELPAWCAALPPSPVEAADSAPWLEALGPRPPPRGFTFRAPTRVCAVGVGALGALCTAAPVLDYVLEMPAACLLDKDQLNHRYAGGARRGGLWVVELWMGLWRRGVTRCLQL